tara:strand:- start:1183 stop:1380 length:198 start_codon:yes stop_codon:yes gene_type:complete
MTEFKHYQRELANLDLDTLDSYEYSLFNEYIVQYNKVEALEMIIKDTDGSLEDLSSSLREIAEKY